MWPAKIGAFTVVLGRHKGNPDISNLPFSYLIENDGESNLLPGINLHSAGTIRDVQKWPKRDLRKGDKIDPVCFDFLSPYTISKALKGIEILQGLLQNMDEKTNFVWYQNCKIKRSAIRKGIELYEMAVDNFLAKVISKKLDGKVIESKEDVVKLTDTHSDSGVGQWVDMAGLLAPKSEIEKLIERIILENISVEIIQQELNLIFDNYTEFSFNFAISLLLNRTGKSKVQLESQDFTAVFEKGKKAELMFNDLILRDAKKEFSTISKIGFGIDGDDNDKNADFEATRGTFDNHPFVIERLNNQ
jgi:hypothetical protein